MRMPRLPFQVDWAPGLGPPRPHLHLHPCPHRHRDWAPLPTSAPGLYQRSGSEHARTHARTHLRTPHARTHAAHARTHAAHAHARSARGWMQLRPRAARLQLCADARANERADGPADGDADARADDSRDPQPGDGVPDDAPDANVRARPRLRRDLAHPPAHICTGTGPPWSTSAPGLGSPLPTSASELYRMRAGQQIVRRDRRRSCPFRRSRRRW